MKKSKILLLAALPAAVLAANVQADPTVYGKLNVSLQDNYAKDDAGGKLLDDWTLDSNASRVGVMGSADLDGGLKGIYKLEYGTDVSNGDATWASRNSYLGVQGNWGTVIGGKFDTPTKETRGKIDQFIDYRVGDISNVIDGEVRAAHIAMYSSPKIADNITVNVAIIPGQDSGVAPTLHNNGPSDGASASVVYDTNNLYLAFAADNHVADMWGETDTYRLAGQVKLDMLALGAIIQRSEDVRSTTGGGTDEKQDGIILSAAYTMNKETLKAQYGHAKYDVADTKVNSLSLGWDHSMSKMAKAYVYVSEIKATDAAAIAFATPATAANLVTYTGSPIANNDATVRTLGVGFEQKF